MICVDILMCIMQNSCNVNMKVRVNALMSVLGYNNSFVFISSLYLPNAFSHISQ